MATAVANDRTHGETVVVFKDANDKLIRRLDGVLTRNYELVNKNKNLLQCLERTARKSKGRRRAIKQLEQALTMEKLRHGYIVPEEMTPEQWKRMLADIATRKVECEARHEQA